MSDFTEQDVIDYKGALDQALDAAGIEYESDYEEDGDEDWFISIVAGEERVLRGGGTEPALALLWRTCDDTWYRTSTYRSGEQSHYPPRELRGDHLPATIAGYMKNALAGLEAKP